MQGRREETKGPATDRKKNCGEVALRRVKVEVEVDGVLGQGQILNQAELPAQCSLASAKVEARLQSRSQATPEAPLTHNLPQ
jgi:hypothetical protein